MRVVPAGRVDARSRDDGEPVLGVVRVVGPGVVLERLDALVAADRPDRAPEEVAEDDDEVQRDPLRLAVQPLGLVDGSWNRVPGVVRDRGNATREIVADVFVLL